MAALKNGLISRGLDGYVRVSIGKGCYLKLPAAHYDQAIAAGKAERRAKRQAAREQATQAQHEAKTLTWIDTAQP